MGIGGITYPIRKKKHINEGIEDEENGRVISSEEFWKNLKNG